MEEKLHLVLEKLPVICINEITFLTKLNMIHNRIKYIINSINLILITLNRIKKYKCKKYVLRTNKLSDVRLHRKKITIYFSDNRR